MKTHSISLFSSLLLAFLFSVTTAQVQQRDVVYLKNGSVIKGIVLEQIPDKTIRIQTSDGSVFVYQMSEVERVVKEMMPESTTPAAVETLGPERASGFMTIFGGGAMPISKFAKVEDQDAGLAKFGWTAGLEYSHISDGGIYLAIGGTYISNPLDVEAMRRLSTMPTGASMEVSPWTLGVPSLSLGFATTSTGVRFLFAADFGYAFCSSPKLSASYLGSSVTVDAMKGNGPAFGGRFGLETPKKVSFIVRYLTTKPKFEVPSSMYSPGQETEQPISVVLFIFGIGL